MKEFIQAEFDLKKKKGINTLGEGDMRFLLNKMDILYASTIQHLDRAQQQEMNKAMQYFYGAVEEKTPPKWKLLKQGVARMLRRIKGGISYHLSHTDRAKKRIAKGMFKKTGVDPRLSRKEQEIKRKKYVTGKITFAERVRKFQGADLGRQQ